MCLLCGHMLGERTWNVANIFARFYMRGRPKRLQNVIEPMEKKIDEKAPQNTIQLYSEHVIKGRRHSRKETFVNKHFWSCLCSRHRGGVNLELMKTNKKLTESRVGSKNGHR